MTIGAILAGIALLIGVTAYVARPVFEKPSRSIPQRTTEFSTYAQLAARRDTIYALIRELDTDHQTNKITNDDYRTLRARYVAEGVSILKQLDEWSNKDGRGILEAKIESRVLALRQTLSSARVDEAVSLFCTQCGHPADPEDRFCARCGTPLKGG